MRAIVIAMALVIACGGAGGGASSPRPGSAAVYERIAALTDCGELQKEFDTADANQHAATPGTEQATWATEYMKAADARMRELRCY